MNKKTIIFISMIFLFVFSMNVFSVEKGKVQQPPPLPKEHVKKLKQIAGIIAGEMTRRTIKTVTVEDFTDFNGKPSEIGTKMAREFSKQLTSVSANNFSVVSSDAEAIVTGIYLPFKEGGKSKLDIKVVSSDKSKIITAYTGIFKKPTKKKK